MKKIIRKYITATIIIANSILPRTNLFAQTLSPTVTPASGGYATAGGVSLSFTTGETFNTTLKSGSLMLTQGEQQPASATPNAVANPSLQTICSGTAITTIALTGKVNKTIYNWTRDKADTITGIAASGAGDIGGVLTNTTNVPVKVTFTITPIANNYVGAAITATVLVNPIPPTPAIIPDGPTTFCTEGSVLLTTGSVSGNQWYLDGKPIGGATVEDYSAAAPGVYTVSVTTNGCTSVASAGVMITVNPIPPAPTITAGGPTTFCTGGSVLLTSGATSGNQWSLNGNAIAGATGQSYIASASGDYTVDVTSGGCTSPVSETTTVTVNKLPPAPTITAGGPTTFCSGGSVSLTSSSTSGNQWYLNGSSITGATTQSHIATASGDYTVAVTSGGCTSPLSETTTVTVNPIPPAPTITAGAPTTFCSGGSVSLTSSSTSGNQWSLNGNAIAGATGQSYIATASGQYTVAVTSGGCTSPVSESTMVTVNQLPPTPTITSSGPASFCTGSSVTLTSSSTLGNQWYLNQNLIAGATAPTYSANAPGGYTVIVTIGNCRSLPSDNITVTINPVPNAVAAPSSQTICSGTASFIALTSNGTGAAFSWTVVQSGVTGALQGNGNSINQTLTATGTAAGEAIYTITPVINGCSGTAITATVKVNPTPNVTLNTGTISCNGGFTTITANATGVKPFKYKLSGGLSFEIFNTFIVGAGTYAVMVQDAKGCTKTTNPVTISQPPAISMTLNVGTINCYNGTTTLTVTAGGGTPPYTYALDNSNFKNSNSFTVGAGTHAVIVKDSKGCTAAKSITIKQPASGLALTLVQKTDVSCLNGSNGLIKVSAGGGTSPYKYSLNSGSFETSNTFSSLHAGTYTVTSKDANGCTKSITVVINNGRGSCNNEISVTDVTASKAETKEGISLKAVISPNPSETEFTLTISGNSDKPVEVRVIDMYGRSVHYAKGSVNQSYRFGQQFTSGVYVVEILQGKIVKTVKIVKGN